MVLKAYRRVDGATYVRDDSVLRDQPSHDGQRKVLIMPALCIGNVGQLAIDLILETCRQDARHIAVLQHPCVLPCFGGNPFQDEDVPRSMQDGIDSHSAHPLDLYHIDDDDDSESKISLFVLQQRAPAAAGCQIRFGRDVMDWLLGCIDEVWIVGSLDASMRHDDDIARMGEDLVRCVPSDESDDSCRQMMERCGSGGIHSLCHGASSHVWYTRYAQENSKHMPWALLSAAKDAKIPVVSLVSFVVEGDNRHDGHVMANNVMHLFHEHKAMGCEQPALKEPPSWRYI